MQRAFGTVLAAIVLWSGAAQGGIFDDFARSTPDTLGDQVIFYYDTRDGFTTFLTVANGTGIDRNVNVLFYGPTFGTPFVRTVAVPGFGLTTIDVGGLKANGLPAQAGIAIATAVNDAGQLIAATSLSGNFTVANLATGSAFGAAGVARDAIDDGGDRVATDTVIAGPLRFQPIRPRNAILAAFYDPDTLAPVSASGNQLIFIDFQDNYGPAYSATSASTTYFVEAHRGNGTKIADVPFTASGVTVTDLASVAGAAVNGQSGRMEFGADSGAVGQNRLIYFTESLGTFGTGYLLPADDRVLQ